jgi:hypothetical protein
MMTCLACEAAQTRMACSGVYIESCDSCVARRLAFGPGAYAASKGDAEALVAAIHVAFPKDYKAGRALVWKWMSAAKAAKEKTK